MSERETAILTFALGKDYGYRSIFRRVELTVPAGKCLALTGGNGTGKTTLLRCLAGLVRPTTGEVRWFGKSLATHPHRRRLIGMVAHESRLYPQLTLQENLVFAARMYGVSDPASTARFHLEQIGLADRARLRPTQISRGMRQRMAVARALLHDPPILLLDEPFASLDGDGSCWLLETLCGLRQRGRTVCFTSHDRNKTRQLADEILELRDGLLVRADDQPLGQETAPAALRRAA